MAVPLMLMGAQIGLQVAGDAMGAIGAYQSEQAQVDYNNAVGQQQAQYAQQQQAFERRQALAIREAQTQQYERNKENIYEALGLNYNAAQRGLDNAYRSAFKQEQDEAIQLAKSIGTASTKGMTGVSASRVDRSPYAERGRNIAIRQQNLKEAQYQYQDETRMMRNNAYSDVLRAFEPISTPLMFGPNVPDYIPQQSPNRMGLATGLTSAVAGGLSSGISMFG